MQVLQSYSFAAKLRAVFRAFTGEFWLTYIKHVIGSYVPTMLTIRNEGITENAIDIMHVQEQKRSGTYESVPISYIKKEVEYNNSLHNDSRETKEFVKENEKQDKRTEILGKYEAIDVQNINRKDYGC